MNRDYKEDVKIDRHKLDECWENQAEKVIYWGEKWVSAVKSVDVIKYRLAKLKAIITKDLRENSTERVTEALIQQVCMINEEYAQLEIDKIEAEEIASMLEVAKNAFYDRRAAIAGLQELWKSSYFTTLVPSNMSEDGNFKLDALEQLEHNERLHRIFNKK